MVKMRYSNLEAEFTRIGLSVENIAKELDFNFNGLYRRLHCKTNWTLNDMLKMQKFINEKTNSNYTLDYLFEME